MNPEAIGGPEKQAALAKKFNKKFNAESGGDNQEVEKI
jgi:hypothetical protein